MSGWVEVRVGGWVGGWGGWEGGWVGVSVSVPEPHPNNPQLEGSLTLRACHAVPCHAVPCHAVLCLQGPGARLEVSEMVSALQGAAEGLAVFEDRLVAVLEGAEASAG